MNISEEKMLWCSYVISVLHYIVHNSTETDCFLVTEVEKG
jgi:hypothetical protein